MSDLILKILVIGDAAVGKSSIIYAFTENSTVPDLRSTIGIDFKRKQMNINGTNVKLQIWDTAGNERYRCLSPNYYRNADGVLLVFDVTREKTFDQLEYWLSQVDSYNDSSIVKMLIANKIDLSNRAIDRKKGEKWARKNSSLYIETSARTQEGINIAFEELVEKILQNPSIWKKLSRENIILKDDDVNEETYFSYVFKKCCRYM